MKKDLFFLFIILFVGFALRFYGAKTIPLTNDEYDDFKSAESLSLCLKNGNFPMIDNKNAGLMGGRYIVYAGWTIFGRSTLGARLPFVIMGIFTIFIVYLSIKPILGNRVAFLTSTFLSISQWHVGMTRIANMAPFELLAILSLFLFYKGISTNNNKLILLNGIVIGVAFFLEEHILILILVYIVFLYFSRYRYKLRNKYLWFSFTITLLLISPLLFVLFSPDSLRIKYIDKAICAGPSLNAIGIYIGELIFLLIKPFHSLFDYAAHVTENEYPMANFVFGLLVLIALLKSLKERNSFVRLLVVWFLTNFVFFSFFRCCNNANTIWSLGSLEWSCLTFIPGVILCAKMINSFIQVNRRRGYLLLFLLVGFMLFRTTGMVLYPLNCYFPIRITQINMQFDDIEDFIKNNDYKTAEDRLLRIYKVSNKSPYIKKRAALILTKIFIKEKEITKSREYLDYILLRYPNDSNGLELLKELKSLDLSK